MFEQRRAAAATIGLALVFSGLILGAMPLAAAGMRCGSGWLPAEPSADLVESPARRTLRHVRCAEVRQAVRCASVVLFLLGGGTMLVAARRRPDHT